MKTAFNKQLKNFNKARKGKEMISARAKKTLEKARRGDLITIFDIKAIEKTKGTRIKKVLPVSIQITN